MKTSELQKIIEESIKGILLKEAWEDEPMSSEEKSIKLMIINNFIEWWEHDATEAEKIKHAAYTYVKEDHVNEFSGFNKALVNKRGGDWSDNPQSEKYKVK